MVWLFKGTIKWLVLALIWLASVVFVTTSALLMDAISDGLSNVFGVSTPYAQQKNNNLKQKAAIKKTRAKSQRLAAKMVTRNVMDAGSAFIPLGGAVIGLAFAAADVYAACELIDIQNEISETLEIPPSVTTYVLTQWLLLNHYQIFQMLKHPNGKFRTLSLV